MKDSKINGVDAKSLPIISQDENLPLHLGAPAVLTPLWDRFYHEYKKLHDSIALPLTIPQDGPFVNAYLQARQEIIIPNDASHTNFEWAEPKMNSNNGQEIISSGVEAVAENGKRYLTKLFHHTQGRVTNTIKLTEQGFYDNVEPPDLYPMLKAFWPVVVEIETLRKQGVVEWVYLVNMEASHMQTVSNFVQILTEKFTEFASPLAAGFLTRLIPYLQRLTDLEREFDVTPGFIQSALRVNDGGNYTLDPLALRQVGPDNDKVQQGDPDDELYPADIGGLDSRGLPKRPGQVFKF